jgi:hypothetical protein
VCLLDLRRSLGLLSLLCLHAALPLICNVFKPLLVQNQPVQPLVPLLSLRRNQHFLLVKKAAPLFPPVLAALVLKLRQLTQPRAQQDLTVSVAVMPALLFLKGVVVVL